MVVIVTDVYKSIVRELFFYPHHVTQIHVDCDVDDSSGCDNFVVIETTANQSKLQSTNISETSTMVESQKLTVHPLVAKIAQEDARYSSRSNYFTSSDGLPDVVQRALVAGSRIGDVSSFDADGITGSKAVRMKYPNWHSEPSDFDISDLLAPVLQSHPLAQQRHEEVSEELSDSSGDESERGSDIETVDLRAGTKRKKSDREGNIDQEEFDHRRLMKETLRHRLYRSRVKLPSQSFAFLPGGDISWRNAPGSHASWQAVNGRGCPMSVEEYRVHINSLKNNGQMNMTDLGIKLKSLQNADGVINGPNGNGLEKNDDDEADGLISLMNHAHNDSPHAATPNPNANSSPKASSQYHAQPDQRDFLRVQNLKASSRQISFAKWTFLEKNEQYVQYEHAHRTLQSLQTINADTSLRLQASEEKNIAQKNEIERLKWELYEERVATENRNDISGIVLHAQEIMKSYNFGEAGDCDFDHRYFIRLFAESVAKESFPLRSFAFDTMCSQLRPYLTEEQYERSSWCPPGEMVFTQNEREFWHNVYRRYGSSLASDLRPIPRKHSESAKMLLSNFGLTDDSLEDTRGIHIPLPAVRGNRKK